MPKKQADVLAACICQEKQSHHIAKAEKAKDKDDLTDPKGLRDSPAERVGKGECAVGAADQSVRRRWQWMVMLATLCPDIPTLSPGVVEPGGR
ncbi:hypothetical protein Tdes44962_MAKER06322 [Teratosphaeria destructans]|uniref:Uncharacterized protein n=1 Tax=Teratosphaeria destructans TaxID=418781 RepID=A0A9W7SHN5_9PEZI|nr:hypothetical protein Tdes44962_MAKER06322 [Teratosphaeria destructans]